MNLMRIYYQKHLQRTAACIIVSIALSGCMVDRELSISFTGDIIMHIPVKNCALRNNLTDGKGISLNNRGFDYLFEKIREELAVSDIVQGNMEFPVSPPYTSKPWVFNCYPEILPSLKKAGFTMVTTANNHILDQGKEGLKETLGHLARYGLDSIGSGITEKSARAGIIIEKKGIKAGFLAYSSAINRAFPRKNDMVYVNNLNKTDEVFEDIAAVRNACDFLTVTVHSGEEYGMSPRPRDAKLFRDLIERGADLVIGHHPHILQKAESYRARDGRTGYIFYSLGNFISNQSSTFPVTKHTVPLSVRDSVIVRVMLKKKGDRLSRHITVIPIRTRNETVRTGAFQRDIRPISIRTEKRMLREILAAGTDVDRASIEKRLKELDAKSVLIKWVLFRDTIPDDMVFDDGRKRKISGHDAKQR